MSNVTNNDEFSKKIIRGMKYYNINIDLQLKQRNRFKSLFPKGKEMFMYLILRAMNAYCMYVQPFVFSYIDGSKFKKDILNFIFDKNIFSSLNLTLDPERYPDLNVQPEQDITIFFDESNDELEEPITNEESLTSTVPNSHNLSSQDKLKNFFDFHFERAGEIVLFKCFYEHDDLRILFKDSDAYSSAIQNNSEISFKYKMFAISSDMLNYLDDVMAKAFKRPMFKEIRFWSNSRKTLFHNYIYNFDIRCFFQFSKYEKCLIRFGKDFYNWNYSENNSFSLESLKSEQTNLEVIHRMPNAIYMMPDYYSSQNKYCISVQFLYDKKPSKPDNDLIKKHLKYFTMNNIDVLDNLALDFVNSIFTPTYLHKNTIISGDYDKFYKWYSIFTPTNIVQSRLMRIYPNPIQTGVYNLLNSDDKEISKALNNNSKGINALRFTHRYFLIKHDSKPSNISRKLVNAIDFPYGGEYYNFKALGFSDVLEIVKLLLVHGWHLLNSTQTLRPEIKQSPNEIFINNLIKTDETRIPLNILHQIYCHFVASGKTDTALHEELENKGFVYGSQKIRKQDSEYLQILNSKCAEHFLDLKTYKSNTQKAISCKLDPKFWTEISLKKKQDTEDKQSAEFDSYLKDLAEKYSKFFVEPNTYQPKPDPYKDFIPLEKIPDSKLQ